MSDLRDVLEKIITDLSADNLKFAQNLCHKELMRRKYEVDKQKRYLGFCENSGYVPYEQYVEVERPEINIISDCQGVPDTTQ